MVDFDKLRNFPGRFYMNAYNITQEKMVQFSKEHITPAHFRAALAYPSIYPPAEIDGQLYFEGADHDPINFGPLMNECKGIKDMNIKNIVLIDVLDSLKKYLVREPRSLWDAYGISIMTPVVSLAEKNIELFQNHGNIHYEDGKPVYEDGKPKEI